MNTGKMALRLALAAALASFAMVQNAGAQQPGRLTVADEEALMRNWIKTLGSDDFGGRKPMTEYEDKTVNYLAEEMRAIGLEPAFDGSYFQKVMTVSTTCDLKDGRIKVRGKRKATLTAPEDLVVWTSRATDKIDLKAAEFVFCGFGIDAPDFNWNDFEGIDVSGKIIIAMVNDPGFYDEKMFQGRNMTYYGRWTYKFEEALRHGAAGCLVLHNTAAASYDWSVCSNHTGSNLSLYDEATGNAGELAIKGWLHEDGCRKLFAAAGMDFEAAIEAAKHPGFHSFSLKVKGDILLKTNCVIEETRNVAGVLKGSVKPDEAVVFSAHWDHFGFGTPDETGDCIYNGAADNGSGMAAVLLLARKYASCPAAPTVRCSSSSPRSKRAACSAPNTTASIRYSRWKRPWPASISTASLLTRQPTTQ